MFFYNKKIVYIDLLKNGSKMKNAGFLRMEENESCIRWTIRIRGLYETDMGYFDLCSEKGEMVDKILLKKGEGGYFREFDKGKNIRNAGVIEDIGGIQISFRDGRCLKGIWRDDSEEEQDLERKSELESEPESDLQAAQQKSEKQSPDEPQQARRPEIEMPVYTEPCAEKWEQLQQLYPTVHPFRDEREFLSITPMDFTILEQHYYRMVRNSFLLHGYYNYRHMILGKYQDKDQEIYYLGVPGVYYEQEKMAAEMFGFEGFEGKNSPAEPGSFGYYMKRVMI